VTTFAYGTGRNRYKRTDTDSEGTTTYYLGGVAQISRTRTLKVSALESTPIFLP